MPKKIGILNFQHSNDNYGAVIQAACLAEAIKQVEPSSIIEHIDFRPVEKPPKPLTLVQRLKRFITGNSFAMIKKKVSSKVAKKKDNSVFEEFRREWVKRTVKTFSSSIELTELRHTYSHVVVGSDQVWRPRYTGSFFLSYFLDFVGANSKKIAYAASFGTESWEVDDSTRTSAVGQALSNFDMISVREDSGIGIVSTLSSQKAEKVLDPTLLVCPKFFEEKLKPAKSSTQNTGIVYYKLDANEAFMLDIKKLEGILSLNSKNLFFDDLDEYKYRSITDWLLSISNSNIVVTDSFHCVCFAIIFKKQFICIANRSRGLARLESLLSPFGLMDRVYESLGDALESQFDKAIDYNVLDSQIESMREQSFKFLKKALSTDEY